MKVIGRTQERVLLSLGTTDLVAVERALAQSTSSDAQRCLALLRAQLEAMPPSTRTEVVDAWADGGSVQVRAITVFADPVDMGSDEARAFAERIRLAADAADAG